MTLPIIDISPLLAGEADDARRYQSTLAELREACVGPGFFYIKNYGATEKQVRELFALSRRFFALPLEEKLHIENVHSAQFRGYTRLGQECTAGARDMREMLHIGVEREEPKLAPGDPLYLRLRGPNLWPAAIPELQTPVLTWMRALDQVALTVVRALAQVLEQSPSFFEHVLLPCPDCHVKFNRYPGAVDNARQGNGPHKDYGLLALLLQDDQGGLQVESGEGVYVDVPPIEGTLVANVGEMLELATSGYFRATMHRVVSPAPGNERFSVAYVLSPRFDSVMGAVPLPAWLAARGPKSSLNDPNNPIYAEFGKKVLLGCVRSHPEVARRHYPELFR